LRACGSSISIFGFFIVTPVGRIMRLAPVYTEQRKKAGAIAGWKQYRLQYRSN
jgi:hypothetical protein